jgi:hypothetical protein
MKRLDPIFILYLLCWSSNFRQPLPSRCFFPAHSYCCCVGERRRSQDSSADEAAGWRALGCRGAAEYGIVSHQRRAGVLGAWMCRLCRMLLSVRVCSMYVICLCWEES